MFINLQICVIARRMSNGLFFRIFPIIIGLLFFLFNSFVLVNAVDARSVFTPDKNEYHRETLVAENNNNNNDSKGNRFNRYSRMTVKNKKNYKNIKNIKNIKIILNKSKSNHIVNNKSNKDKIKLIQNKNIYSKNKLLYSKIKKKSAKISTYASPNNHRKIKSSKSNDSFRNLQCSNSKRYSSLVVDANTKRILHGSDIYKKRYPASTTKVMTLFIIFDQLRSGKLSLNDRITVGSISARQPRSALGVKAYSKITVRDAIYALVVKSANDISHAVAIHIAGSIRNFASMMNDKARSIGMKGSHFTNPHGLFDPNQYTTGRDLALLTMRIKLDHPQYFHFFSKKAFYFQNRLISGHNNVLKRYRWATGLKTGYIKESGFNLITTANKGDTQLIGVVLGCPTASARDNHMIDLLEAAYHRKNSRSSSSNH